MITISLCMIVKNEEAVLARCLDGIKDAVDEIIIVDTGSTDNTKDIAARYTNKIYDFEWIDNFSAARNEAFSKATMDYQMWLDADDVFPKESLAQLLTLKETLDEKTDIVTMKYVTHFDENGLPILVATRERLLRREKDYKWQDPVHECIALIGNVFYTDIEVHHRKPQGAGNPRRNLDIYENYEKSGKPLSPRQLYYFARELKDNGHWERAARYFERFLATGEGWYEDNIAACYNLSICYAHLGQQMKILPILLRSFEYSPPRAEICCQIGYYYKRNNFYASALKWFEVAANLGKPDNVGFILQDYWGYIPNIEACVCSWHLGKHEESKKYNEYAAAFKSNSIEVENNRAFFASLK